MEDKKWRLRVVTSNGDKPPVLEGVATMAGSSSSSQEEGAVLIEEVFHKQEVMDYCLPDREEVLFR